MGSDEKKNKCSCGGDISINVERLDDGRVRVNGFCDSCGDKTPFYRCWGDDLPIVERTIIGQMSKKVVYEKDDLIHERDIAMMLKFVMQRTCNVSHTCDTCMFSKASMEGCGGELFDAFKKFPLSCDNSNKSVSDLEQMLVGNIVCG